MTKMKNYTDRLHGEGASGIMELQKSNEGGGMMNKRVKYSILIVCLTVLFSLLAMWLVPDSMGYPREITREYAMNTLVPKVYEIVQVKYILPLCAVILGLLGVFVWSLLDSVAAGHPLLTAVCVIFSLFGVLLDLGLLAVHWGTETVSYAVLPHDWEDLTQIDLIPSDENEWMAVLIAVLVFLFQWWMLNRKWRIVRYLPLAGCVILWILGEVLYATEGGWGGMIGGGIMVWLGFAGIFLTGLACVIWHIRKFCKNRT